MSYMPEISKSQSYASKTERSRSPTSFRYLNRCPYFPKNPEKVKPELPNNYEKPTAQNEGDPEMQEPLVEYTEMEEIVANCVEEDLYDCDCDKASVTVSHSHNDTATLAQRSGGYSDSDSQRINSSIFSEVSPTSVSTIQSILYPSFESLSESEPDSVKPPFCNPSVLQIGKQGQRSAPLAIPEEDLYEEIDIAVPVQSEFWTASSGLSGVSSLVGAGPILSIHSNSILTNPRLRSQSECCGSEEQQQFDEELHVSASGKVTVSSSNSSVKSSIYRSAASSDVEVVINVNPRAHSKSQAQWCSASQKLSGPRSNLEINENDIFTGIDSETKPVVTSPNDQDDISLIVLAPTPQKIIKAKKKRPFSRLNCGLGCLCNFQGKKKYVGFLVAPPKETRVDCELDMVDLGPIFDKPTNSVKTPDMFRKNRRFMPLFDCALGCMCSCLGKKKKQNEQ